MKNKVFNIPAKLENFVSDDMLAFLDLSSNIRKLLDFARYKPFCHDSLKSK